MNINLLISELQNLIAQGVDGETQVKLLSANGIQLSSIEKIELGKSIVHIVESK